MSEVRVSRGGLLRAAAGIVPVTARLARAVLTVDVKKPLHAAVAGLIVAGIAAPVAAKLATDERYRLPGGAGDVITKVPPTLASKLRYDAAAAATIFNAEGARDVDAHNPAALAASAGGTGDKADQLYTATMPDDPAKGIKVTDNVNSVSVTFRPQFGLLDGRKVGARVHYPLEGSAGQLLFTPKGNGVKEDILLEGAPRTAGRLSDEYTWSYDLDMPDYLEAKLEADGSVGIYSADPQLFGKIQYGTDKDRESVEKARQANEKTYRMFSIPAPVVAGPADTKRTKLTPAQESGAEPVNAPAGKLPTAHFTLDDNVLSVHAAGLVGASYPLSIDPTFVLTSTQDFVLGSIDDNIDLSVDGQVGRQTLVGGSTPGWNPNDAPNLAYAQFASSLVAYNGYLYLIGGGSGGTGGATGNNNTATSDVRYISLNPNTGALGGTAPTTWTQTSKLLNARQGLVSFGFNGYLYAVGGQNTSGVPITTANSVEYAKINADGTLGAWSLTTGKLNTARAYPAGAIYQGYLYVMGGTSGTNNATPLATTEYARINGDGTISSWTQSSSTATGTLTTAKSKFAGAAYNGFVYVSGGQTASAALSTIEYAPIQSDGSLGAWQASTSFPTARRDQGMVVNNGYIYVFAGCNSRTQACPGFIADTQYAVINADGSIGQWQATVPYNTGGFNARMPAGYTSYSNHLYFVGGCSAETATNKCATQLVGTFITDIDSVGRFDNGLSNVSGTAPYTGTNASARYGSQTVAANGYLYRAGGCSLVNCPDFASDVEMAPLGANGTLGTWSATTSLPAGRMGHRLAAYNDKVYVVGGAEATTSNNAPSATSITPTTVTTAATAHNVTMPATVAAGDLLVAINENSSGATVTTPTGWTLLATAARNTTTRVSVYAKAAAGNEGGTTVNFVTSATATMAAQVYRVLAANWYGSVDGGVESAATDPGAATANPNPPYLPPSWGTANNLWIAAAGGSTYTAVNAYPSGYSGGTSTVAGTGTAGASIATSVLQASGADQDPGAYTMSASANGVAATIAVRPAQTISYASSIQTATQNLADGTLGSWSTQASLGGSNLPVARGFFTLEQWHNYVYVLGGRDSSTVYGTVYYAAINPSTGLIGGWNTTTTGVSARWGHSGGAWGNWLYVIGGQSNTTGTYLATTAAGNAVQQLTINPATGNITAAASSFAFGGTAKRFAAGFVDRGFLYSYGGDTASAVSSEIAWAPLDPTSGNPGTFSTANIGNRGDLTAGLTTARSGAGGTAAGGYFYLTGGCTTAITNTSYQACTGFVAAANATELYLPNNGGTGQTGSFSTTTALPQTTFGHAAVAYNGRLYVMGGCTAVSALNCTSISNAAVSAPISPDGTIGAWTAETSLPAARYGLKAVAYNNRMYVTGGFNTTSNPTGTVWYAPIAATGTLGVWTDSASNYLPSGAERYYHGMAASGRNLYVVGGRDNAGNSIASVYMAAVAADGSLGGWTSVTGLPAGRANVGVAAYNGVLYAVGGTISGTSYASDIYYNVINSDGTLGSWVATTDIAGGISATGVVAANGYLYVMGSASERQQVQYASILANGTLGAMTASASSLANYHDQGAAVFADGTFYVLGGAQQNSTTYTNFNATVERAGQQAISRVGHYSKLFNTGVDTSPTQVVINGATAGPTSAVEFKFQTASQGDPVLGVAQLIRPVSFGQYYNVQALNSAGVNVGTAFNYLYQITLDDSRSGTFPDVVRSGGAQTAVTDITLYYRASPSRRLRHGAAFNDEGCRSDLPTADGCILDTATR